MESAILSKQVVQPAKENKITNNYLKHTSPWKLSDIFSTWTSLKQPGYFVLYLAPPWNFIFKSPTLSEQDAVEIDGLPFSAPVN
jgi:hypothetical protein